METLADYQYRTEAGFLCAVTVFAVNELLAVIDFWSVDGQETASSIPPVSKLKPMQ